jgi:hypothetical protein
MEQSPYIEADNCSAYYKIPCLLWNQKLHYHAHNSLPPVPFLSKIDPFHNLPHNFLKLNFDIVLPSTYRSSKCSLPFRLSNLNFICISYLLQACYMHCPSHPSWLDYQVGWSKWSLETQGANVWARTKWLRIGLNGRLLWTL